MAFFGKHCPHAPVGGSKPRAGFTMVEMVVVVVLLLIIAAMTLPAALTVDTGRSLRDTSAQIQETIKSAQEKANTTNKTVMIQLIPDDKDPSICREMQMLTMPKEIYGSSGAFIVHHDWPNPETTNGGPNHWPNPDGRHYVYYYDPGLYPTSDLTYDRLVLVGGDQLQILSLCTMPNPYENYPPSSLESLKKYPYYADIIDGTALPVSGTIYFDNGYYTSLTGKVKVDASASPEEQQITVSSARPVALPFGLDYNERLSTGDPRYPRYAMPASKGGYINREFGMGYRVVPTQAVKNPNADVIMIPKDVVIELGGWVSPTPEQRSSLVRFGCYDRNGYYTSPNATNYYYDEEEKGGGSSAARGANVYSFVPEVSYSYYYNYYYYTQYYTQRMWLRQANAEMSYIYTENSTDPLIKVIRVGAKGEHVCVQWNILGGEVEEVTPQFIDEKNEVSGADGADGYFDRVNYHPVTLPGMK